MDASKYASMQYRRYEVALKAIASKMSNLDYQNKGRLSYWAHTTTKTFAKAG